MKLLPEQKSVIRKNITKWINSIELNEGEGFYIYPTKDRIEIVIHLPNGSYREDIYKSLKERMGDV